MIGGSKIGNWLEMQKEMNDMRGKVFEEGIVNYVGKKKKRKDLV